MPSRKNRSGCCAFSFGFTIIQSNGGRYKILFRVKYVAADTVRPMTSSTPRNFGSNNGVSCSAEIKLPGAILSFRET